MDFAIVGILVGVVSAVIALVALKYQHRQTKLAEEARKVELPKARLDVLQRMFVRKYFRIGYLHYPPFAIAPDNENDDPTGLYVELLRQLCTSSDIKAEFREVRLSSAISSIVEDKVDAVLSIFQTPRRARTVDFTAFLHSVTVSGVTRRQEDRISSQADLTALSLKFVVCREEIGHEFLEEILKIPEKQIITLDTGNVSDILEMVAARKADVAIADGISCQYGLMARGLEGPKLKPILRRRPLYLCPNGVMIAKDQLALSDWLENGLKKLRREPAFVKAEQIVLDEFAGIVNRM